MQALQADPKTIRQVFVEEYTIPDFQRKYSWEKEQCDKLWTDIWEHFENSHDNQNDKYFIGSIVLFKNEQDGKTIYQVVDGQQRLTTMSLLIKALYNSNQTMKGLEHCLKKINPTTANVENKIRIESKVIDEDRGSLETIILDNYQKLDDSNKFRQNYEFFLGAIEKTDADLPSSEAKEKFILYILDRLVMLPIVCGSEDDAITIFERLNDTGLALSDTDIFKSKLYKSLADKEGKFIKIWNEFKNHDWLFRVHMHYCRAKQGVTESEIGLRRFFNSGVEQINTVNAESTLKSLMLYQAIHDFVPYNVINAKIKILSTHPNNYWQFPYYLWLAKHGRLGADGNFELTDNQTQLVQFNELMETLHKFCVVCGIVHRTVNAEKSYIFNLCRDIIQDRPDYLNDIKDKIEEDKASLICSIDNTQSLGRYLGIVLYTSSLLNGKLDDDFLLFLDKDNQIEHILPRKWANCNYWTEEAAQANMNRIGNLVLLEKTRNIQANNDFFERKKEVYKCSESHEVRQIAENYEKWDQHAVEARHQAVIQSFKKWLEIT